MNLLGNIGFTVAMLCLFGWAVVLFQDPNRRKYK